VIGRVFIPLKRKVEITILAKIESALFTTNYCAYDWLSSAFIAFSLFMDC